MSPSWLGDSLMAMPAIRDLKLKAVSMQVVVVAKPAVAPLWRLCPSVDEVIEYRTGWKGMRHAVAKVRAAQCDFAYIVPHSFRSAWIPFLAGVPGRRGFPGHCRRWLLTETVRMPCKGSVHQTEEGYRLFGVVPAQPPAEALIKVGEAERAAVRKKFVLESGESGGWLIGMFPGAARGAGKRWPAERFAEVGKQIVEEQGCKLVLFGAEGDRQTCCQVAAAVGGGVVNLAGSTTLTELAALLMMCRVVVANDSGGMHLAAAVGTPVVALYGVTDPVVTGPMGEGHVILMIEGVTRGRDVSRGSAAGQKALAAVSVDAVHAAVKRTLACR